MKKDGSSTEYSDFRLQLTGELAIGVAHDFNNLLATVLGSLELMDRRVHQLPEDDRDRFQLWIKRSIASVQRAGELTSRLLAFSRRQPEGPVSVDVNNVVSNVLSLASGYIGRRIHISTNLQPDIELVRADLAHLESLLLGLLFRSREAMPRGGELLITTEQDRFAVRVRFAHTSVTGPESENLLSIGIQGSVEAAGTGACVTILRRDA